MRSAAAMRWLGGAIFLSFVIAAVAWFVLISPLRDATDEARERVESEQARIDQLEIQLAGLRADFAKLDEFKAELEQIRVHVPTDVLLNELTRQIDGLATQAEVFVLGLAPGIPYAVESPVVAAPPPPPADGDADEEDAGDAAEEPSTDTAPVPTGPQLPAGFYAVPFQMVLLAPYEETLEFVENLQRDNPRLVLVNSMTATAQDEQGAQAGRPDTAPGDLETTLGFIAWVLLDAEGNVVIPEDGEVPAVDLPSGNGNPFAPLQ